MTPKTNGRPSVLTKPTVLKLEQALRDGFTIEMACHLSGISRSTYYAHLQNDVEFMNTMELSQSWATERAKQVVIQAINKGDLKAAQWWLERKLRGEFSTNLPLHYERQNASIQDRYFGGNPDKFMDFMGKTLDALEERQPETNTE